MQFFSCFVCEFWMRQGIYVITTLIFQASWNSIVIAVVSWNSQYKLEGDHFRSWYQITGNTQRMEGKNGADVTVHLWKSVTSDRDNNTEAHLHQGSPGHLKEWLWGKCKICISPEEWHECQAWQPCSSIPLHKWWKDSFCRMMVDLHCHRPNKTRNQIYFNLPQDNCASYFSKPP